MKVAYLIFALAAVLVACAAPDDDDQSFQPNTLQILGLNAPQPMISGTEIRVQPQAVRGPAVLRLTFDGVDVELPMTGMDGTQLVFSLDDAAVAALGLGEKRLEATLSDGTDRSVAWEWPVTLADEIPTTTPRVVATVVDWDQSISVVGGGFIFEDEGLQDLRLEGRYVSDAGEVFEINTFFPLSPTDPNSRSQATFPLIKRFGTDEPGVFAGEAYVTTVLNNGVESESVHANASFEVRPADVLEITPEVVKVGEFLTFTTVGLESGPGRIATVYFDGRFTNGERFNDVDFSVTAGFDSQGRVRLGVIPSFMEDRTVAAWFGESSGAFAGEIIVGISGAGVQPVASRPYDARILISPVHQWVQLVAAADFDAGLRLFGLEAARADVLAAVERRLQSIFGGQRVTFTFTRPEDVLSDVIATLTLSGLDTSRRGLRGHDVAPWVDLHNSDMADEIGGNSALVQQGSRDPGYGGVFLENFFVYSEAENGPEGQDVDPLFDTLFGTTVTVAATPDEVAGSGDPERVAAIEVAVTALANLIAEEAAHEVGHAFGLPPAGLHNVLDAPGCLMDAYDARPLGERAGQPGFAVTTFCGDSAAELDRLLGR